MSKAKTIPPCPPEYTPEEWAEYHRDPCAWCIKELHNPKADIRCNSADILRGLGRDAVSAVPALIEGCQDRDQQVRAYCAHALAEIAYIINKELPKAVPSLKPAYTFLRQNVGPE